MRRDAEGEDEVEGACEYDIHTASQCESVWGNGL